MRSRDPAEYLPLKPNWFHILLSLADGPRHGYGVMGEVKERTGGKLRLWPTTVYGSMQRMEDAGIVAQVDAPEGAERADERRLYYGLTPFGRQVLLAETDRLQQLVDLAHARTG